MFYGSAYPIALHTIDIGSSNITGYNRVFGIVFKISSTQWVAVNV
jgi:hypothetical protein